MHALFIMIIITMILFSMMIVSSEPRKRELKKNIFFKIPLRCQQDGRRKN